MKEEGYGEYLKLLPQNKSPTDIKIIVGIPVYTKRGYPQDYRF